MDSIILYDENNNEVEFNIIDTFGVDDRNFCALQEDDDELILIMEIINKDDEIEFKSIENQDELDEIIKLYEEMREESNGN
ncbi:MULTISPECIES: DUF1292 domain-containing protein [Anaerococcus]|uniref:DUF1292 domain-containing protein n=1 Tax=Anaerococcus nagyae TaxID=1755241 RepID=A0A3E2TIP4_9FIRM|nr:MULTISPECIES: DUF1292 domain-containing protein [Anaerococcus]MDU2354147.1 DUF1292 domain-containing protein [Anaerococcus sp.]MDU2565584.1 DUF1292 domain-containing protein [Anaerococcus sp.]MDU3211304.1 DUF1292 domain-containing protein [Anaerococcus sp.]RGB76555.1 DUF1292 domain-containing protein [Anaerococcus nagyae]